TKSTPKGPPGHRSHSLPNRVVLYLFSDYRRAILAEHSVGSTCASAFRDLFVSITIRPENRIALRLRSCRGWSKVGVHVLPDNLAISRNLKETSKGPLVNQSIAV